MKDPRDRATMRVWPDESTWVHENIFSILRSIDSWSLADENLRGNKGPLVSRKRTLRSGMCATDPESQLENHIDKLENNVKVNSRIILGEC